MDKKQTHLWIVDGATFVCGPHKGTFRAFLEGYTINDLPIGLQTDVDPHNFEFVDGFQLLSIGKWQRIGQTTTIEDQYPLLFRSFIQLTGKMPGNSPVETYLLKFTNAGQDFMYEDFSDEVYQDQEMVQPLIRKAYFTDIHGNIIEKGTVGQNIYLVIEGENLQYWEGNFDLQGSGMNFAYKGTPLKEQALEGYLFSNNEKECIPLSII